MISIYSNLPAATCADALSSHYGRLKKSAERLSSGLRVNCSADDAAGLAIRELMRADVAALTQGLRNANDAISMLQTFDGALSVIDEKLIRMGELAEQAATGTYDSTQRLIIDSEFQAMAAEIDRIARSTDFNGIRLLDGEGSVPKGARGIIAAGDAEYDVTVTGGALVSQWPTGTATQTGGWDISGIANPDKLPASLSVTLANSNIVRIDGKILLIEENSPGSGFATGQAMSLSYDLNAGWRLNGYADGDGRLTGDAKRINGQYRDTGFTLIDPVSGINVTATLYNPAGGPIYMENNAQASWTERNTPAFTASGGYAVAASQNGDQLDLEVNLGNGNIVKGSFDTGGDDRTLASVSFSLKSGKIGGDPDPGELEPPEPPADRVKIHFGTMNDSAEDYYCVFRHDATIGGLGLSGVHVKTQDAAQETLVKVREAIVRKDEIRADYGALQNRFENTVASLRTQTENLKAAESRISDTDIAHEMSLFVRNQILSDTATAMLAQANFMPQMVMRLIGDD